MIKGISVNQGIAIARSYILSFDIIEVIKRKIETPEKELEKFQEALQKAEEQLKKIEKKVANDIGQEEADIFGAHIMMMKDPSLVGDIEDMVNEKGVNIEYAVEQMTDRWRDKLANSSNDYMRQRAADLDDIKERLLRILMDKPTLDPSMIEDDRIVVCNELSPSQAALLDPDLIKGVVTQKGSTTSHAAIIVKSKGIPTVFGAGSDVSNIDHDIQLIVDASEGKVFLDFDDDLLGNYREKLRAYQKEQEVIKEYTNREPVTTDGTNIDVYANLTMPQEIKVAIDSGAGGVGLFRTEFKYQNRDTAPSVYELLKDYKQVAKHAEGREIIIRTADIGGDKPLDYLKQDEEKNPFLGLRGIRLSLKEKDLFKDQIQAILKASPSTNLKIMLPMISNLDELRQAKILIKEVKDELKDEKIEFNEDIQVGIMVEVPSVAIRAGSFIKECDFFSIGTNDLTQYTLATDRMNEKVAGLYDSFHPAVLELIKRTIDATKKPGQEDKFVGLCGEFASDERAAILLLGLGIDELSMSANAIAKIKRIICNISTKKAKEIAEKCLEMDTATEVKNYLEDILETLFD